MQVELASLAYAVVNRALALRDRLERGEPVRLATEQATLKKLLLNDVESKRWADFGGETGAGNAGAMAVSRAGTGLGGPFLGIRYALVCWLDELFIVDSPWEAQWNEQKLELALYGTNDRAWRFWEQAKMAETRPGGDALEVFFLCVMLGFRGDLAEDPVRLQQWVTASRSRIGESNLPAWNSPPELDPVTSVPPRHGREQMQRMVMSAGILMLILLPIVTFIVVQELSQ